VSALAIDNRRQISEVELSEPTLKTLNLNEFPIYVALGSAACIIVSVSFDWGYFTVIGKSFFLAMTLNDHIAAALDRIPMFLFSTGIGIVPIIVGKFLFLIFSKTRNATSDESNLDNISLSELKLQLSTMRSRLAILWRFLIILLIIFFFATMFLPGWYYLALLEGFVFVPILFAGVRDVKREIPPGGIGRSQKQAMLTLAVSAIILVPTWFGHVSAIFDLEAKEGKQAVTLVTGDVLKKARILRYTSSAILLRDAQSGEIRIITLPNIKEIKQPSEYKSTALLCTLFGWCLLDKLGLEFFLK
jgi:hypothetical protein